MDIYLKSEQHWKTFSNFEGRDLEDVLRRLSCASVFCGWLKCITTQIFPWGHVLDSHLHSDLRRGSRPV